MAYLTFVFPWEYYYELFCGWCLQLLTYAYGRGAVLRSKALVLPLPSRAQTLADEGGHGRRRRHVGLPLALMRGGGLGRAAPDTG